ncbi:hypothetical protein HBB16_01430 [Pseudonocardia sp. MCCB 268]|nr:hypothetical protein [Pseudonocardia cytotoxica]
MTAADEESGYPGAAAGAVPVVRGTLGRPRAPVLSPSPSRRWRAPGATSCPDPRELIPWSHLAAQLRVSAARRPGKFGGLRPAALTPLSPRVMVPGPARRGPGAVGAVDSVCSRLF